MKKPAHHACPHCDSAHVAPIPGRTYVSATDSTWYQCAHCKRMWSVPKHLPIEPTPPPTSTRKRTR